MEAFFKAPMGFFPLALVCILLLVSCSSLPPSLPDSTTESPTEQSPASPSYCLQKGRAAEAAGDLGGAYRWYSRGGGANSLQSTNDGSSYQEPEAAAYFQCNLNFVKVCEELNEKGIIWAPAPESCWLGANCAENNLSGFIYSKPSKTYMGYTVDSINAMGEQSVAITKQAGDKYDQQQAQHYANVQSTMDGLNTAATALNAGEAATTHPSSSGVNTPTSSSAANPNAQAAISQCSQNAAYLHWTGVCQNANAGNNQGPCYCAAAALLRCYYQAAPNDPSASQWKQDYQQNIQNAQSVGMRCFNN